jgi:hypothetical protein
MSDLPKFYIINNGMKDLRGHYFETAISIAEAAKDMGWHPILAGHASCEISIIPEWLKFYPIFRVDHWMDSPPYVTGDDEIHVNLKKYEETSIENVINENTTFEDYIKNRFYINPDLSQKVKIDDQNTKIKNNYFMSFPPIKFAVKLFKKVLSILIKKSDTQLQNTNPKPLESELFNKHVFYLDLSKLLAVTRAKGGDFVFLPTAHGRELLAITDLLKEGNKGINFGLEFRYSLEPNATPIRNENSYLEDHLFYFKELKKTGLPSEIKLFTDTIELAKEYQSYSNLPFQVLPIPLRQKYIYDRPQLSKINTQISLVFLGDAREEKGFHWLPYLVENLAKEYFETEIITLHVQVSMGMLPEPRCQSALRILKSYPSKWIKFYGLNEALTSDNYYALLNRASILLCPYNNKIFANRSAGTLADAIAAGIPTIVPSKTWLASEQPEGTGLNFDDLESFLTKSKFLIDNFNCYQKKAIESKQEYSLKHNTKELIKLVTLTELKNKKLIRKVA